MQPFPLIDRVETNYAPFYVETRTAQSHDPAPLISTYSIAPLDLNSKRNARNFAELQDNLGKITAIRRINGAPRAVVKGKG